MLDEVRLRFTTTGCDRDVRAQMSSFLEILLLVAAIERVEQVSRVNDPETDTGTSEMWELFGLVGICSTVFQKE